jgi:hypothetical protein
MLGAEAVAVGDMSKSGFVAAALRELSVGLCKGNYLMHRSLLGVLAGVAGLKRCDRKKAAWLAPFLCAASLFSILLVSNIIKNTFLVCVFPRHIFAGLARTSSLGETGCCASCARSCAHRKTERHPSIVYFVVSVIHMRK